MNSKVQFIECAGCFNVQKWTRERIVEGDPIAYIDCEYCEGVYCTDRCYRAHDCVFHSPEIVACIWCNTDCELSKNKLGHETRPALIDGDPVCAACAFLKPWDKPTEKFILEANRLLEMLKAKKVEVSNEKL